MKTTLYIADNLLIEAKKQAKKEHVTLRSLVEEGLSMAVKLHKNSRNPKIKPVVFNGNGLSSEFRGASWESIRSKAYEGHGG